MEIRWLDAHALSESWVDPAEMRGAVRVIRSCGYLLESMDGHHVIVQSLDEAAGTVDTGLAIPSCMVVSVVNLLPETNLPQA